MLNLINPPIYTSTRAIDVNLPYTYLPNYEHESYCLLR